MAQTLDEIPNVKLLGKSEIGLWKNYVDLESIEKCCEEKYVMAMILSVQPVLINGIDIYDEKGNRTYNTKLKYQSKRNIMLFDCNAKMIAYVKTSYYKTKMPFGELVYEEKRARPIFIDLKYFAEKSIFKFVCSYKLN
jgi:hypothetical protein